MKERWIKKKSILLTLLLGTILLTGSSSFLKAKAKKWEGYGAGTNHSKGNDTITYGSVIRLRHKVTGRYLASDAKSTYDHDKGSGQAATYAVSSSKKNNSQLWIIKGPHAVDSRWQSHLGTPVRKGALIRLEHLDTGKNLHTHTNKSFPTWRSPATKQWEATAWGTNGIGNGNDNWRIEWIWEGSHGVMYDGCVLRLKSGPEKTFLHSHAGHWYRKGEDKQEVTAYWNPHDFNWWVAELVSSPAQHDNHGVKALWQKFRGGTLNYNTIIWIDPLSTMHNWEEVNSEWQNYKKNYRRLWTHAGSRHSGVQEPNKHLELMSGPWIDIRTQEQPSWFMIQDAKDPVRVGPVQYGRSMKVFSLFAGRGSTDRDGILNPRKQWWVYSPSRWGGTCDEIVISRQDQENLRKSNRGEFVLEPTFPGVSGNVHQNDPLQIRNLHTGKKLWLHTDNRWGGTYHEVLLNKEDDFWGWNNNSLRNHRSNIWHRWFIRHVPRKWVSDFSRNDFDKIVAEIQEDLGAAAAKQKLALETAKRIQAEAAIKHVKEEIAEEKKKVNVEAELKIAEARILAEEMKNLSDLPLGFMRVLGDIKLVTIGEKKKEIAAWALSTDNKLMQFVDGINPWQLHAPKTKDGSELSEIKSVSIGSDGTTYAVTSDYKVYRYNYPGETETAAPSVKKKKKRKKKKAKKKLKKKKKAKKKKKKRTKKSKKNKK